MDQKHLERLILKACLTDKSYLITVSSVFEKSFFDDPVISDIFQLMKEHVDKYNNIMPREGIVGNFSGEKTDEVRELFAEIDTIDFDLARNYEYLFDQTNDYLKDKAIKRAILDSVDIINSKPDERAAIRQLVEAALCKDLRVDIGLDYFSTLKERLLRILSSSTSRIPTYYSALDEYLNGGFPPFTFSVIVARVHGFKSNTLANFAARQVLKGQNVAICSMEMSQDAFAQRFDSIFTNLDINKIYTIETVSKQMVRELKDIRTNVTSKLFIKQFPTGEASTLDINRYLRELTMRDMKPDILYLDYINIMKPSYSSKDNMYADVKRIAEECRALSFKFEIPVVSVSQLNREGSIIAFDEVDFVYIAESMGVPATADFMAIYGVDEEKLVYENELHYKIVKNRLGGRVGEIDKFLYDSRSLKMYDSSEIDLWIEEAKKSGDDRNVTELTVSEDSGRGRGRRHDR